MSLNSRFEEPEPTFDSETAARALVLAARLQEARDARIGAEELFRTAEEAGIAPDLLDEALRRVGLPETRFRPAFPVGPSVGLSTLGLVLVSLVYFALHAQGAMVVWGGPTELSWWAAVLAAFAVGLINPRRGRGRLWGPLLVVGMWFALLLWKEALRMDGDRVWAHPGLGPYFFFGLVQAMGFLLGFLASRFGNRAPWAKGEKRETLSF